MSHRTIAPVSEDAMIQAMADHMTTLVLHLRTWVAQETPDLQRLEEQVLRSIKDLGGTLLASLCQLTVPPDPPPTQPCACGQTATFQRLRAATCRTVLGPITLQRPYYLCAVCHHGVAPLDQHLGLCAGSRSAGLDELLALLGATQDSFAEAATVLERLTLLQVAPNTVRAATEQLGAVLAEVEQAQVAVLEAGQLAPHACALPAGPLCVSLDGIQAHLAPDGWKELCIGAVYQVRPCRPTLERRADAVQAEAISYIAELGSRREAFGWQLYAEALRRGADAGEVVVVGDGAHWLWELAELHFPQATQILDWFHATEYIWSAATAIWGEAHPERQPWADGQLRALWEGQVGAVLLALQDRLAAGDAVRVAYTYLTNQQARMDYPAYRARGLPIGSGTIESGCKQLVSARLKQAGMIWSAEGARGVAKVRAWLRGGRWHEAMALRPPRQRHRRQPRTEACQAATAQSGEHKTGLQEARATPGTVDLTAPGTRTAEVVAGVRHALRQERQRHPWRRAWSVRQQRREREASAATSVVAFAA
jgi:hypothetical protein